MSKFLTVLSDVGFGIAGVIIAWIAGYIFIRDEEFVRLGLDIAGFFLGLSVSALARFEIFRESIEHEITSFQMQNKTLIANTKQISEDMRHLIGSTSFLADFAKAMQRSSGLITEVLRDQLYNYQKLLADAANGHVTITSAQPHTIVNYTQFFEYLEDGTRVMATALLLPTPTVRKNMNDVNQKFIESKHGRVTRIFVIPVDSSHVGEWQEFVKEQKAIGVSSRFLFRENMNPGTPVDDILITDMPRRGSSRCPRLSNI